MAAFYTSNSQGISDTELAKWVGISRQEALDSIKTLCALGYIVEAHPQWGYRLLETPDALMADDLHARLHGGKSFPPGKIGGQILVFEQMASTQDMVQRLARAGYSEGLVVFAEAQSAGRGRMGREWFSPLRKGLWFTVLLRPPCLMQSVQRLTVMTAVAVASSLRRITGLPLRIKWPNDILCNGRKVIGILTELSANGPHLQHATIGIGINVNLEVPDFPPWLQASATSLKQEAGQSFHRPSLAIEVLRELDRCQFLLSDENFPMLLECWMELDDTLGRQISISWNHGRSLRGLASDLDFDGALLVRTDEGRLERVTAGDVTLEKEIL